MAAGCVALGFGQVAWQTWGHAHVWCCGDKVKTAAWQTRKACATVLRGDIRLFCSIVSAILLHTCVHCLLVALSIVHHLFLTWRLF